VKRYSREAYQQLFLPDEEMAGRVLMAGENGRHDSANRDYFEWWYFDMAFADGSWLVVVFYAALFNVGDRRPTLDVRYYPPQGERTMAIERFTSQDIDVDPDPFRVRLGQSWVIEEENAYHLHVQVGALAADLMLRPELPGWRVGSGRLFADVARDAYFHWVIPMPRARVEGRLTLNGNTHPVVGVGYHDHNWGNVYLPNVFRGWTWGRLWGDEWALVLGDMLGRFDAPRTTAILVGRNGVLREVSSGLTLREEASTQNGKTPSQCLMVESAVEDLRVSLAMHKLETIKIAALRPGLVPLRRVAEPAFYLSQRAPLLGSVMGAFVGAGVYHRWSVQGRLCIEGEQVELNGVVERLGLGGK
jgi:hypothetical protein